MSFSGPEINKRQGGLNRLNPSTDGVFLLIYVIPTAALPGTIVHNTVYPLYQPEDAKVLGVNEALDANENLLAFNAISEFFRIAPESQLLFMPVDSGTPVAILQLEAVKTAIRGAKDAKGIAIGGTTETVSALAPMLETIQSEVNAWALEKRLFDFVLLQGNGEAVPLAISAYPDLREKNAPNVCLSIAQDPAVASLDAAYAKYADIGAVLGGLSVRRVNENLGSVDILSKPRGRRGEENYTITGLTQFVSASLSDGKTFDSLGTVNQNLLTNKGYIYAGQFEGYDGVYFNNAPTCVELASDYAYIENNRVWNKAAREVRRRLIPKIRGIVKKDPTTGYLRATSVAAIEGQVNKALDVLLNADEISGYDTFIDPNQIISESSPLQIKISIVKDDIIHEMDIDLGYATSI